MNKHFSYNFVAKTIIGSKRSISRANKGLSPEYAELTQMLAEHPDFRVAEKIINQNENKKTYSKLTFERMETYISLLPNAKEKLIEFEAVKKIAEARGAKYPLTKKWFLTQFPEYKESEIVCNEVSNLDEEAETAA